MPHGILCGDATGCDLAGHERTHADIPDRRSQDHHGQEADELGEAFRFQSPSRNDAEDKHGPLRSDVGRNRPREGASDHSRACKAHEIRGTYSNVDVVGPTRSGTKSRRRKRDQVLPSETVASAYALSR